MHIFWLTVLAPTSQTPLNLHTTLKHKLLLTHSSPDETLPTDFSLTGEFRSYFNEVD
jgi:hypothetical protein